MESLISISLLTCNTDDDDDDDDDEGCIDFHSDVWIVPRRVFLNVVLVVVAGLKEVAGVIPMLIPRPMLPI